MSAVLTKTDFIACPHCGTSILRWFEEADVRKHQEWHEELDARIKSAASVGVSGDRAAQMSQPLGG